MCSKAPKGISYSTSESADFRFSATVARKNIGKNYIIHCLHHVSIPMNEQSLQKHADKYEKTRLRVKEKTSQPAFKKKRLELKAQRAQLRNRNEQSEQNTYQSNMTLLDSSQPQQHIQILDIQTPYKYENHNLAVVFFDLETSSLKANCDILQISMKCHQYILNIFITPTQSIQSSATKVNGFSKVHKKLFQHEVEVPTISKQAASKKVLEFLKIFQKKCILVAHNCTFDSMRFLKLIKQSSMQEEYEEWVYAFCDTLKMFREKFPKRASGYKLTTLATELLNLDCDRAHDAQVDVSLLEKLCLAHFSSIELTNASKTIYDVMSQIENSENIKLLLPSFKPMDGILSSQMKSRLASYDITYDKIVNTFKTKSIDETKALLERRVNGKPTVIKTKKIINMILDHLIALP